ncbi:hypothetical protein OHA99_35675 [Streptomyces coelicoflavus]|uniref:hypothetical protein n=1 Tax=Streptomyces TaxID=1883 RepID=UPI0012929759|nr:hypothetical protein [Streptomyces sp. SYP-A7193]
MTAHPALIETTSRTTAEFRPAPRHVDRAGAVRCARIDVEQRRSGQAARDADPPAVAVA